jgi:hypothetical protein
MCVLHFVIDTWHGGAELLQPATKTELSCNQVNPPAPQAAAGNVAALLVLLHCCLW